MSYCASDWLPGEKASSASLACRFFVEESLCSAFTCFRLSHYAATAGETELSVKDLCGLMHPVVCAVNLEKR